MSSKSRSWKGKVVRHEDGRRGTITDEFSGYSFVSLTIHHDAHGFPEGVQLHSNGPDSGARGWYWLASEPGEPETWAPLGDHNIQTTKA